MSSPALSKISRPRPSGALRRKRLFRLLDDRREKQIIWISGPGGSGKTTLAASYLDERALPCLWYQVDGGDSDIASFFYYIGLAAKKAAPRHKKPMPLLTPEYLQGVPTFTRRYFEELFRRLTPPGAASGIITPPSPSYLKRGCRRRGRYPKRGKGGVMIPKGGMEFVVVFDNFQDASSPVFHEMLSHAFDTIPEGITVLVLSRSEPPPELSRLRANDKMSILGWNDLRFTDKECSAFLKTKDGKELPDETVRQLYNKTDGWAAGLVLMTEAAKTKEIQYPLISELSQEAVFGYFANEIFEKTDKEIRDFLLKTSFFPSMTAAAAEELTGNKGAKALLSRLSRNHYFTDWRPLPKPTYQYHPLFRYYLQARARDLFGPEELNVIRRSTAAILEEEGRVEDAATLYIEAANWDGLAGLIRRNAQPLVSQGRTGLLNEWITSMPEDMVDDEPWLLYWAGICRMLSGPAASRPLFEKAFGLFQVRKDETGTFLAWASIVDTFFHEWSDLKRLGFYIDWLNERVERGNPFPSPKIAALVAIGMSTAYIMMRKSYADFRKWIEHSLSLAHALGDVNMQLRAGINAVQFYVLTGDFMKAKMAAGDLDRRAKSPSATPLLKSLSQAMVAFVRIMTFETEDARPAAAESIKIAEESGIHIWDDMLFAQAAHASMCVGDLSSAAHFLERLKTVIRESESGKMFVYHLLSSGYHLMRGETAEAYAHAENTLGYIEKLRTASPEMFFNCHHTLSHAAHARGDRERASRQLRIAGKYSLQSGSAIIKYMYLTSEAYFAFDNAEREKALSSLREAMTLGKRQGYFSMLWWWQPDVMAELCGRALEEEIEVEYVTELIRRRRLLPPSLNSTFAKGVNMGIAAPENWPYPVKIYTLGRFRFLKDENPIEFSGKVQKRPLLMLKALIAQGGKGIKEEQLADMLWPEADGDAASKSVNVTITRLRQLLGVKEAVEVKDGMISLNPSYCWVDAFSFLELSRQIEKAQIPTPSPSSPPLSAHRRIRRGEKGGETLLPSPLAGEGKGEGDPAISLMTKALDLYKGSFLQDVAEPWAVPLREKLLERFLRYSGKLGRSFEGSGEYEKAVDCYRRALEVDEIPEEFYQRLMICHDKLGRRTEAISVYNRCKRTLAGLLGIDPSAETDRIYEGILKKPL